MLVVKVVAGIAIIYLLFSLAMAYFIGKLVYSVPKAFAPSEEKVRQYAREVIHTDYDSYEKWEKEYFVLRNGDHEIPAEYHPLEHARGCAIVAHGFGQNRYIMVSQTAILRELGFSTILFDQRKFGVCKDAHGGFGIKEGTDVARLVEWVREKLGEDTKIVLLGASMGAISVLNSQQYVRHVDAIIEDSSPDRVIDVLQPFYKALLPIPNPFLTPIVVAMSRKLGCDIRKNNPVDVAAGLDIPVCILHGEADRTVPVAMAHRIKVVLKHPLSRMELFPGRDHTLEICDLERYTTVVAEFIDQVFAQDKIENEKPVLNRLLKDEL
ncbi:MAG: alpha/beta hydrolase [Eubacterium sp.]|nr:alpha/beta hydrolase [Eubacterium sp.]